MSIIATQDQFEECLLNFYNQTQLCSTEINKWTWKTSDSILKRPYLVRETNIIIEKMFSSPLGLEQLVEESDDPTIDKNSSNKQVAKLEHHIAYSTSYQVPVLYLRVSNEYGTPLSLEEVYKYVISPSYQHVALSQMEHPVLGTPFWYIHPCDTRKLMSTIQFQPLDYIKSWLSVYGPITRCYISKDMFM